MLRLIPPVAVPVTPRQVAATIGARDAGDGEHFAKALAERLARPAVSLFGSGRAALTAWLEQGASGGRDEVVLPAYTCWTVPAAVVRAGLRVRLVDVDPTTLAMDPDVVARAVGERTTAVVAAHLFAPSCDVSAIADGVRRVDPAVRVLEDAAQAWPEAVQSRADAVLLSFGRGKPLPLGHGGALASARPLPSVPGVRPGGWFGAAALTLTVLATHPRWYRIPESLPWLGVGTTEYQPNFARDTPMRAWQARLGVDLLAEFPQMRDERTANARRLCAAIETMPSSLRLPLPARAAGPIRLPVLVPSRAVREALLPALRRRGVAATGMYPGTLGDIPPLAAHRADHEASFPGAEEVRDRLLTLPVYPGLDSTEVDQVASVLAGALREVAR